MKNWILGMALALVSMGVVAQEDLRWHEVLDNPKVGVTTYVDLYTIKRSGDQVTFWTKRQLHTPRPYYASGTYSLIVDQQRVDCARDTAVSLAATFYADADGAVRLGGTTFKPGTPDPIQPETILETISLFVCNEARVRNAQGDAAAADAKAASEEAAAAAEAAEAFEKDRKR